ncbi:MAG: PP2C family protein-serine/threonine phosphatase [Candidatus Riflemargulisbacteria bacterium]
MFILTAYILTILLITVVLGLMLKKEKDLKIKIIKETEILKKDAEVLKQEAEQLIKTTDRNQMKNKRDLDMARRIQSGLLSTNKIQYKKYQLTALCMPAEKIGGDFFIMTKDIKNKIKSTDSDQGVITLKNKKDETINFAIGDVSGHGVASALVMILSKNTLEDLFSQQIQLKPMMEIANKRLLEYTEGSAINFVTIFGATLDVTNNKLTYSKAGHTAPILLKKNNSVILLETEGVFLGMFESPEFEQKDIILEQGDKIFLYTDGLTEAKDETGELFGTQRLIKILQENNWLSGENLFQKILDEIKEYSKCPNTDDDLTMMLLEYS